ncbi:MULTISPECIES: hypothetical protein [Cysteiniphilum]|uniref:hypothetical protein n=1 Tax=Cysteiniphilum TaxID=2056696 RepID=UPI0017807ECE|nr:MULTISPECIES: hypothetical protein [Cysteiniphilum]
MYIHNYFRFYLCVFSLLPMFNTASAVEAITIKKFNTNYSTSDLVPEFSHSVGFTVKKDGSIINNNYHESFLFDDPTSVKADNTGYSQPIGNTLNDYDAYPWGLILVEVINEYNHKKYNIVVHLLNEGLHDHGGNVSRVDPTSYCSPEVHPYCLDPDYMRSVLHVSVVSGNGYDYNQDLPAGNYSGSFLVGVGNDNGNDLDQIMVNIQSLEIPLKHEFLVANDELRLVPDYPYDSNNTTYHSKTHIKHTSNVDEGTLVNYRVQLNCNSNHNNACHLSNGRDKWAYQVKLDNIEIKPDDKNFKLKNIPNLYNFDMQVIAENPPNPGEYSDSFDLIFTPEWP